MRKSTKFIEKVTKAFEREIHEARDEIKSLTTHKYRKDYLRNIELPVLRQQLERLQKIQTKTLPEGEKHQKVAMICCSVFQLAGDKPFDSTKTICDNCGIKDETLCTICGSCNQALSA